MPQHRAFMKLDRAKRVELLESIKMIKPKTRFAKTNASPATTNE